MLQEIVYLVIRDEARHVTFGVNYLEEFVQTLSQEEREERAQFALRSVRRHARPVDSAPMCIGNSAGRSRRPPQICEPAANAGNVSEHDLFARIVPNLKRIGLLTDAIRPKFEELGLLEFEALPDDGHIDWDELSKPLYEKSA